MEAMRLSEIADVVGGNISIDCEITDISTDTRKLTKGCLFIALTGDNFDGNDFAAKAVAEGAAAAVTNREIIGVPCIVVKDTNFALLKIAAYYRKKFNPILVGVTGSVGKTTTKEMIALVLSSKYKTLKTQGNLNNHIGLPKTLLNLDSTYEAAVIEMGMSHFGEISVLSKTASPRIGVITNIGYSHIENLKNQEGILKAKLEILDGMSADAPLVVNADDPYLKNLPKKLSNRRIVTYGIKNNQADIRAEGIIERRGESLFTICTESGKTEIRLPSPGEHNIMNALAAFAVGKLAGVSSTEMADAFCMYKPEAMRQNIIKKGEQTVIMDCYNASPDSMRASLLVLRGLECSGRKIAVLGDMLELGDMAKQLHTLVGDMAAESGINKLFCYGKNSVYIAKRAALLGVDVYHTCDMEELCRMICKYIKSNDAILFKASRGIHLEKCVERIYE
ncbi:MAG: UDP-N-acetylmuramoyl-tripeptide--D-alanyl-D-alanine ligase [Oscillospiraceae bacterium]|nr:UDP-N-acetylmuramoyl-tripeptide--D-alanyl-D-alanine ligase [Oscillospiraceae bacterium]MDY3258589.1 UDP-N-acetylmuramoyl-tripeptide--D-alanyl-D-alanine ligase [Ruminococcus callidus]